MTRWIPCALPLLLACGNDKPPPSAPDPVTSAAPSSSTTASTTASASASAAPSAAASVAPAPPKGKILSFTRAKTSGTVDKVGDKDGNFKPDGVKDTVFELEYEGAATAIFVMTTDKDGALTSELDADTMIGEQAIPKDIAGILNAGKNTYGLAVYENDKLANAKDGSLTSLAEGKHKLVLHVSAKEMPKSAFVAIVLLPDASLVKSAILPK